MATIQQLEAALRKADAAGNSADAKRFADAIRKQRTASFSDVSTNVDSSERIIPQGQEFNRIPQRDDSRSERVLAGIGKSFVDTGRGIRQTIVNELADPWSNTILGRMGVAPPEIYRKGQSQGLVDYNKQLKGEEAERRRLDPGFTDDLAFTGGNVGGTLLQILGPGIVARGTAASSALLPTTIRGNAAQGGVIGAIQPVADEAERGTNAFVGALSGAFGTAIPKALGKGFNAFRSALSGQTLSGAERAAGQIIADAAGNPAALKIPAPSAVPGVQRTLAQETGDSGVGAIERMVRGRNPGAFGPQDAENNAARVRVLEGIAGTDADMANALAARSAAGSSARQDAMQAGPVDISQTVSLLDDAIAGQEGRPAIQAGLRQVRQLLAQEVESAPGLVTTSPESRIQVLDNVRQTIGDMLSGKYGGENAAALQGSRELIGVRDALNSEIGSQVPRFTDYLNAYRQMSQPINRMELGSELLSRASAASPADVVGTPLLQAAPYGRAMGNLDAIAAKATGFSKAKASDILDASDMASLRAIEDDMARIAISQRSPSVGSQTDANQQLGKQLTNEAAREAAKQLPLGLGVLTYFQNKASIQIQEKLAYLLANPAEARRVLAALPPKDRATLNKLLIQLTARPAAAAPALTE